MAKKEKKEKKEKMQGDMGEEKSGGVVGVLKKILLALLIFLVAAGIVVGLIKFDVGGFGSLLTPIFGDTPILKYALPEDKNKSSEPEYNNLAEAIARINELEAQLKSSEDLNTEMASQGTDLQKELDRLKVFEQEKAQFDLDREQWYNEIVNAEEAPDPANYTTWYEKINAKKAEELYAQLIEEQQVTEAIQSFANTYSSMDASAAAQIFNGMTADLNIVAQILNAMKEQQRAAIIAELDVSVAQMLTKYMSVGN